ncbi:MAG TPA: P1 family peptidase [Acidimicrobiales bacterium]|nr:P1 family peptidase [Acidimicrobiales bacterium]
MLTEVDGVRVGHHTDDVAATGCTVVLFPEGTVASGEVRGGAPATRETDLLHPTRLVSRLDAVVLTGGSAFGLASADGVVRWCEAEGRGFPTAAGPVPIVVALGLFDLMVGAADVRPGPAEGHAASEAASTAPVLLGRVGAGTGATWGKWRGREHARPGGLGGAVRRHGDLVVAALVAVNALGDIAPVGPGAEPDDLVAAGWLDANGGAAPSPFGNTTIGVVATNAAIDKVGCHLVAQAGHDGLARALVPAHTRYDGDALVVAATGVVPAGLDAVRALAATVVAEAVTSLAPPPAG